MTSSFQVDLKDISNTKNDNVKRLIAKQHLEDLIFQKRSYLKVRSSVRPYFRHTFCLKAGRAS